MTVFLLLLHVLAAAAQDARAVRLAVAQAAEPAAQALPAGEPPPAEPPAEAPGPATVPESPATLESPVAPESPAAPEPPAAAEVPSAADAPAAPERAATPDSAARPVLAHSVLQVDAEAPHALVWDAERHLGAAATRDAVLLLEELRDGRGRPAGALGLAAAIALREPGSLALGHDDGSVYAPTARNARLHGWLLTGGAERTLLAAGGPQPEMLFQHPVLHKLVSFNAGAGTITLFDLPSSAFEGLIPLGDAPVSVQMGPAGNLLALLPERRELTAVSLRPFRTLARWALPGDCLRAIDLTVDPAGQRAFVACGGNLIAPFDLRTASWTATLVASTSNEDVLRVFWDGVRKRVISVTHDGTVAMAADEAEAVRVLALVPAGSVVDYDAAAGRLVWAGPGDENAGLHAGITPVP